MIDLVCRPLNPSRDDPPLRLSWDPATGDVFGPGAAFVLRLAQPGARVNGHPVPISYQLGDEPLRSYRDMAIIIGSAYALPPELGDHYQAFEDEDPAIYDGDGNVVDQVTF